MIRGALLLALVAGCAASPSPSWKRVPHDRRFQQVAPPRLHARPRPSVDRDWWDRTYRGSVGSLAQAVSPARWMDAAMGGRRSLDINHFGEVPDSPWFENRIGRRALTPDEVGRGADLGGPPAGGPLHVLGGEPAAAAPELLVRDAAGAVWTVQFDPPAFPELRTGAEAVAARLLWAGGWHVPETHVVSLDVGRLRLAAGASHRDRYRRRVPLRDGDLRTLVAQTNPDAAGRVRALFRRAVPGVPLGPFEWRDIRRDDPNDRIPHERRRSLRGLWVFQAWLNNIDIDRRNTLDTFVLRGPGRGWVRHWLVDLGQSLGASGGGEKQASEGYEPVVPWNAIAGQAVTFGLEYPYWNRVQRSPWRAVGIFEAEVFDPARWQPRYPNPAFDEATPADTFWAAAILSQLGPAHVRAAIAAAGYSEPGAADWIHRVLMQRRAKLLRFAFRKMLPLADPEVAGHRLRLRDLEVVAGLRAPARYLYRVRWDRSGRDDRDLGGGTSARPDFDLGAAIARARADRSGFAADPFLTVSIWKPRGRRPGPRIDVHLRVVGDHLLAAGIDRDYRGW